MFRFAILIFTLVFLVIIPTALAGDGGENGPTKDRSGYQLESAVIGAAGAAGSSTSFLSNGTLGQSTPIGIGVSDSFRLYAGFWKKILVATGVLEGVLPDLFKNILLPNIPNPFNPQTTIRYEVGEAAPVEITIYNIQGRAVRTLVREAKPTGRYEVVWDGRDDRGRPVGSGVYLYRLQIGSYGSVKKMVLVK